MAVALSPIPSGRRSRRASLRVVAPEAPARPAHRSGAPCRPLPSPSPTVVVTRRVRTRAACITDSRTTRPSVAVRRRRVLLGTVATGLLVILALPWGGTGGSLATPGPAPAGETGRCPPALRRPAGRHAVVHRRSARSHRRSPPRGGAARGRGGGRQCRHPGSSWSFPDRSEQWHYGWRGAVSVVSKSRRQGRRLAPRRGRRRHPPPARVPGLRPPVHDL